MRTISILFLLAVLGCQSSKTILYGALWKPSNFDLYQKDPLIDDSYTDTQAWFTLPALPMTFRSGIKSVPG